eukprot:sb/3476258/
MGLQCGRRAKASLFKFQMSIFKISKLAYATGPFTKGLEGIPRWGGMHNQSYLQFQIRYRNYPILILALRLGNHLMKQNGCSTRAQYTPYHDPLLTSYPATGVLSPCPRNTIPISCWKT